MALLVPKVVSLSFRGCIIECTVTATGIDRVISKRGSLYFLENSL